MPLSSLRIRRSLTPAAVAVAAMAFPALALGGEIPVTTTADVVDPADGVTSLREAVAEAAANPWMDTVRLGAGQHVLDDCAAGALPHPSTGGHLRLAGPRGAAVRQTCPGLGALSLTGRGGRLVLERVTVRGPGGAGGDALVAVRGRLRAEDATITDGAGTGVVCSPCAGARLERVTVRGNAGGGARVNVGSGTVSVIVIRSTLRGNTSPGAGGGLAVGRAGTALAQVVVDDTVVEGNRAGGPGGGIAVEGADLQVTGGRVRANRAGSDEEPADGGGIALRDGGPDDADLRVAGAVIAENLATGAGGGIAASTSAPVRVVTSWVDANTAGTQGGGIAVAHPREPVRVTLMATTLSRNAAGEGSPGGGIAVGGIAGLVGLDTSTVSGNSAGAGGGIGVSGGVMASLWGTTVAGNAGAVGANLALGPQASAEIGASILAAPVAGAGCGAAPGAIVSLGHSLMSDTGCGPGPADRVSDGDPGLGPLAANGGPTPTRLPSVTSPAAGLVPAGLCAGRTDQRGITRPQGPACEAGAVEITEAG